VINKEIIEENNDAINKNITSLLNNQKVLSSDIKNLKKWVDENAKKS